jgi:hypothetical protein
MITSTILLFQQFPDEVQDLPHNWGTISNRLDRLALKIGCKFPEKLQYHITRNGQTLLKTVVPEFECEFFFKLELLFILDSLHQHMSRLYGNPHIAELYDKV